MEIRKHFLGSGKIAWYRLAALIISAIVVTRYGMLLLSDWQNVKGWEAYWVAKALVAGEGFSMPSPEPWGYDVVTYSGFHPTAWADPFYTFLLAGLISLFGGYHQLAAAGLNLAMLFTAFGLTYYLGERLISAAAGVMAVLVLASMRGFSQAAMQMNNTMLAANLILLSALVLARYFQKPSYRRAGELGLVLGITALGCPSAQFFILVASIAIAVSGWRSLRSAAPQAMLVLVLAILVILPWSTRNYLIFGTYVPMRTGAGWNSFAGVVATAGTVAPEKLHSHAIPPWREKTIRQAVKQAAKRDVPLDRFQMDYAIDVGGAEFVVMNEARRDSWFLKETKSFILANPVLSTKIAIMNMETFIRAMGFRGILVCMLAALGGLLCIRTPIVLTLALWAGSYIGPFLLIICYYDRYRAPIEPLLVVLASFAVWRVLEIGYSKMRIAGLPQTSS